MPAKLISIGEPAHDAERQAIGFIVENLPETYTVYSNAWLVERTGVIYEVDAVVVAPHGIFIIEIKSYRGKIWGNDHDWYDPSPIRSPIKLNRKTAQLFGSALKRHSYEAGRRWVEHFVFLSHTTDVKVDGPASRGRVHTRKSLIDALQDVKSFAERTPGGQPVPVDAYTADAIDKLLTGVDKKTQPTRFVREYQLLSTLDRTDRYVEHLAEHKITKERKTLRIYPFHPLDEEPERRRTEERCRWEAQVLARVGQHPNILRAAPPFLEEVGICLPLDYFAGVTLLSWVETHGKKLIGKAGLKARVDLWTRLVDALLHAHSQGVVHRLLRPEAVLVEDKADDPQVRLTGFELAKQLDVGRTIAVTTMHDDRLRWAAPEVIQGFSNATPQSDQFGVGALLGIILTGRPLFESTQELVRREGLVARIRDLNPFAPQSLDDAVLKMLAIRPADRFTSLEEARSKVLAAVEGRETTPAVPVSRRLDPENLTEGTRLEPDYEIISTLGSGGLATVYAARHLISGTSRALKVARPEPRAEEALQGEYRALSRLDHKNIVKVVDLSKVVPERLTLVMERVKGSTLTKWLSEARSSDAETQRKFAEDLLAALAYLEGQGVTHKDIKPDNLVVGNDGLTLIDFSLVDEPPDSALIGTALYRDPALRLWDHSADRYAASLCLFELYAGRHPFNGRAPSPGEQLAVDATEFDAPGLAGFFRKALHPNRDERYPSAVATRSALLEALGKKESTSQPPITKPASDDANTSLGTTSLSGTSVAALLRSGVRTQGDLASLSDAQIRNISGLGNKKRQEVLAFRSELQRRGISRVEKRAGTTQRSLWPSLVGDETELHRLGLAGPLAETLIKSGFSSVGRLAGATREDLLSLAGLRANKVALVVEALQKFGDRGVVDAVPSTLDGMWRLAVGPLRGHQENILARHLGVVGPRRTQQELITELGLSQFDVSEGFRAGLMTLHRPALDPLLQFLEDTLDTNGAVLRLGDVIRRVEERWTPSDEISTSGLIWLCVRLNETVLAQQKNPDDETQQLLLRPDLNWNALELFVQTARQLAGWPLTDPEASRRELRKLLPEYEFDPLVLATRLLDDVFITENGELYETPVDPKDAIEYVIRRERLPIALSRLRELAERTFPSGLNWPEPAYLNKVISEVRECRIEADQLVAAGGRSIFSEKAKGDPIPLELLTTTKRPEVVVGERLGKLPRGYRLVVTPPETHFEISRSIARALPGATFVSFEQELLARMDPNFDAFERAEKFKASRPKLKREAEALLEEIIESRGQAGRSIVVGDTAILEICDAEKHVVRRLYEITSSEDKGLWVLAIPGVIFNRQPMFNEKTPVFHLDGQMLPLPAEIPPVESSS